MNLTRSDKAHLDKILVSLVAQVQASHSHYMYDRILDMIKKTASRIQMEITVPRGGTKHAIKEAQKRRRISRNR